MSTNTKKIDGKTIEELRKPLQRLKTDLIDDDELYDRQLFRDALSSLSTIGKERIYELKNDVYEVLNCWNDVLRAEAVSTLGYNSRLYLLEFKDKAYEIWKNDPDQEVKRRALSAWICYFAGTRNKKVLMELYRTLINKGFDIGIRATAYISVFELMRENLSDKPNIFLLYSKLIRSSSIEEFESKIDWNAINEIMKKYAPEALEGK